MHRLAEEEVPGQPVGESGEVLAEVDLDNLGSGVAQALESVVELRFGLGLDRVQVLLGGKGESRPLQVGSVCRVSGGLLGDDLVDQRAVLDGAREDARGVECVRDRRYSAARPPTGGRFEAHDTHQ